MLPFLVISFFSGLLVKLTDFFGDRNHSIAYLFGTLYGISIGYLLSQSPFSMLFLGALFAQALANKIDRAGHLLGFVLAFLVAFYFGFPSVDPLAFFLFITLAYADELSLGGNWKIFTEYRLFLKSGALLFALLTARWDYFFGVLVFDAGYLIVDYSSQRFLR